MWKLNDKTTPLAQCAEAIKIKETLEALNGQIPEIVKLEVGFDFSETDSAWDIVLYSEFATKEDLDNYQKHPAHVAAGKAVIAPYTNDRKMIDYEI